MSTNCGFCHTCRARLIKVLDGEEWCPKCRTYRRYRSHGFRQSEERSPCQSKDQAMANQFQAGDIVKVTFEQSLGYTGIVFRTVPTGSAYIVTQNSAHWLSQTEHCSIELVERTGKRKLVEKQKLLKERGFSYSGQLTPDEQTKERVAAKVQELAADPKYHPDNYGKLINLSIGDITVDTMKALPNLDPNDVSIIMYAQYVAEQSIIKMLLRESGVDTVKVEVEIQ